MNEETITIREFLRNHKKFTNKKNPIIITKNGKPEMVIISYNKWEKDTINYKKSVSIWDMFEKYVIEDDNLDPNLSQNIDEIVYGAPNPHRNDND